MKTSTSGEDKRELQRRVEEAERNIQYYKGLANQWESKATGYEERLGVLRKEGGCRTWQCIYQCLEIIIISCISADICTIQLCRVTKHVAMGWLCVHVWSILSVHRTYNVT